MWWWIITVIVAAILAYAFGIRVGVRMGYEQTIRQVIKDMHDVQAEFATKMAAKNTDEEKTKLMYNTIEVLIDGVSAANGGISPETFRDLWSKRKD